MNKKHANRCMYIQYIFIWIFIVINKGLIRWNRLNSIMNSTTIIELENYYLKKLKDIDDYIDIIKTKDDYKEKRMFTIMKLDYIEKEIMTRDWSNNDYIKRKNFRPVIYKLYKKLDSCPPKRNQQDFERKYEEEYKDPEHNSNREDLSNCEAEVYTETFYDKFQ